MTGKSLARSIDMRDAVASTRARLIAIAISELVFASWTELAVNPDPKVPPTGARASWEAIQSARQSARKECRILNPPQRLRMIGLASGRRFFSKAGTLWAGGLRLADDPFPAVGWDVDLLVEHGSVAVSLGHVRIDTITVGAAIVAHHEWSIVSMRAGAGLRIGAATMTGEPSSPLRNGRSVVSPWGWPLRVLALSVTPIRPLVLELQGEAGYVVLPLGGSVGGGDEITLSGAWAAVQFGAGMFL